MKFRFLSSISSKLVLFFCAAAVIPLVLCSAFILQAVSNHFNTVENEMARRDRDNVLTIIDDRRESLRAHCLDYAVWDKTYEYVANPDEDWAECNLYSGCIKTYNLDITYITDAEGLVIWAYDKTEQVHGGDRVNDTMLFTGTMADGDVSGFLVTEKGTFLVSSHAVLRTDESGPSRGALVIGRLIDENFEKTVSKLSNNKVGFYAAGADADNSLHAAIGDGPSEETGQDKLLIQRPNSAVLETYSLLQGIDERPALVMRVQSGRSVFTSTIGRIIHTSIPFIIGALLLSGTAAWFIGRSILSRVKDLTKATQEIIREHNMAASVPVVGNDELCELARSFNVMVAELAESEELLRRKNDQLRRASEELKQKHAQVVFHEKMTSVGQLAAGVAHEFNNILTSIMGYGSMAKTDPEYMAKFLETVLTQGERALEITEGLLNFSRSQTEEKRPFNIAAAADEVLSMIESELSREGIDVVRYYKNVPPVVAGEVHVKHALLNIIGSSRECLPEGGVIKVAVQTEEDMVGLEISNNGKALPKEVLNRMFEPFFGARGTKGSRDASDTCKPALAVAHFIIEQSGGTLKATSEEQVGTAFTILLPAYSSPGEQSRRHRRQHRDEGGGASASRKALQDKPAGLHPPLAAEKRRATHPRSMPGQAT
ncbi:MAG: hypothetical protein DRP79_07155 [Planctomycetota bacterium]|nr:MAG: hypothetical protein DRP79_07155 [Planctomycetota bacterium]